MEKECKYLEYHELLKRYKEAEKQYRSALDEKAKLLYNVMPHSIEVKPIVNHLSNSTPDAKITKYTAEIDQVEYLINSSRNTRDCLKYELKKKELELKQSDDEKDNIYYYKWIKRMSPYKFYRIMGCSIRKIYNLIRIMKKELYGDE